MFCIPFTSGIERISLERVFIECFKRLYSLAVLTFNCDPVATVISCMVFSCCQLQCPPICLPRARSTC